jgi:hypothetical protein
MATDFVIIPSDASLSVGANAEADEEREFTLPQGSKVDSKSVLFLNASFGVSQNSSIELSININTKKILSMGLSSYLPKHSYHVIVPENLLKKADKDNNIEFELKGYGNGGNAYLSEAVLLIQTQ